MHGSFWIITQRPDALYGENANYDLGLSALTRAGTSGSPAMSWQSGLTAMATYRSVSIAKTRERTKRVK